jgi:hypothetical protein
VCALGVAVVSAPGLWGNGGETENAAPGRVTQRSRTEVTGASLDYRRSGEKWRVWPF